VLYGDSYLRIDLSRVREAFRASRQPVLMTVLRNQGRWGRSNANFDGELVTRYSKTEGDFEWVDYGLSIFTREVAGEIPPHEPADLADLYARLSRESRLAGYEVAERFYEIGSPESLAELERSLDPG
jgi:MurNAc alpha-1-phosphate uridylyltransferase